MKLQITCIKEVFSVWLKFLIVDQEYTKHWTKVSEIWHCLNSLINSHVALDPSPTWKEANSSTKQKKPVDNPTDQNIINAEFRISTSCTHTKSPNAQKTERDAKTCNPFDQGFYISEVSSLHVKALVVMQSI